MSVKILIFLLALSFVATAHADNLTEAQKEAMIPHYVISKACNTYISARMAHRYDAPNSAGDIIKRYNDTACGIGGALNGADLDAVSPAWVRQNAIFLRDAGH